MMRDITVTSIETITAFDISTGAYKFMLDELQNVTVSQSEEVTDITGKAGRKLSTLKRNKSVTISGTNGFVSGGLLEMQTGSDFENKTVDVMWTDYLTVSGDSATTSWKAVGTAGSEIDSLYVVASDGALGDALEQDATAGVGTFAYNPASKTLSFSGIADNTEIVVLYKRRITADVHENMSDKYSGKCALYVDAIAEDKCANIYHVQFYFPKADFNGEFSIDMGDNQTVHAFEAEALAGACGAGGKLWTYVVFGADSADSDGRILNSIAVTTAPTKTSYDVGDSVDAAGMVVTATYDDGTEAVLNNGAYTFTPNGVLTAADRAITVRYTENGVTRVASTPITVSAG